MNQSILIFTAASLGFVHTILGPDHYIPFIAISRAKKWPLSKTLAITAICGIGHVVGSVVLGLVGVLSGIALENLEVIESLRGSIAAYALIVFGLVYAIYGFRKVFKNKPHKHVHIHADGTFHTHTHIHKKQHAHIHNEVKKKSTIPWILFIIFVFGPCEVLIPVLMYPAAQNNYGLLITTTIVFAVVTIITMLLMVTLTIVGFHFIQFKHIEKYSHALAGVLILLCGIAVQFLGI